MPTPIDAFLAGRFVSSSARQPIESPIRRIVIEPSLEGREEELVRSAGVTGRLTVVSDENTHDVLGARVARALGGCDEVVLDHPHADDETAAGLRERVSHADALVAVGSGTLNDLCKHVTATDGRPTAVFATAASMNGYVTSTASITKAGYKQSLASKAPVGVFFDLEVLSNAPLRMTRAGVGDACCRATAQLDWLLSHRLLGTPYSSSPFDIQMADETVMLAATGGLLEGDLEAMAALVRILTLGGLGMAITGTSHSGSMGEHGISHYIDMFADPHPGSLHGEQIGVTTLTMTRLQSMLLAAEQPPVLRTTDWDEGAMRQRYGDRAGECIDAVRKKHLDADAIAKLNERLGIEWPALRRELSGLSIGLDRLTSALRACGAAVTFAGIGLDPLFYAEAVGHAHEIRDRFTFLDLAAHSGVLDGFAESERHSST